jgi:hypothetical protein
MCDECQLVDDFESEVEVLKAKLQIAVDALKEVGLRNAEGINGFERGFINIGIDDIRFSQQLICDALKQITEVEGEK